MLLNILFGSLLILFCSNVIENCMTPNGGIGKCVHYNDCETFNSINEWTSATEFLLKLSIRACKRPEEYIICCNDIPDVDTLTTIPRTIPTTTIPTRIPTATIPTLTDREREKLLDVDECGEGSIGDKVVGGNLTGYDEFPWMTLLKYNDIKMNIHKFQCGGSLINNRYVLTAAHCLVGEIEKYYEIVNVRIGDWNYSSPTDCEYEICNDPIDVEIDEIIPHENYFNVSNLNNRYDDIGLIRLKTTVEFTDFIKPICLPKNDDKIGPTEILQVAGWGIYDKDTRKSSDVLLKANVRVNRNCKKVYRKNNIRLSKSQICVGGEDNIDSCSGDSGGPLMRIYKAKYYVFGLVSFGPDSCGTLGWPSIYTKVYSYRDWLKQNVRP